jgi:beta-lactamase superfamily II metal-dependent hydrolase
MATDLDSTFRRATGRKKQLPGDWMPTSRVRPFIVEDPAEVWLEFYGTKNGFQPDSSPFEFLDFLSQKNRQFLDEWVKREAPGAVQVCQEPYEVIYPERVKRTLERMSAGLPVIVRPALWWAGEKIYSVPSLIIHTAWLKEKLPGLLTQEEGDITAPLLQVSGLQGHYTVFDIHFISNLGRNEESYNTYSTQARMAAYILGQMQGRMPVAAFLVSRDRLRNPLKVEIHSTFNKPLDKDLAQIRNQYIEIRRNGDKYRPWEDTIVEYNLDTENQRWRTAKSIIAREKISGGDVSLVYQVGKKVKEKLIEDYPTLEDLLEKNPSQSELQKIDGIGPAYAKRIRAIIQANRSGQPYLPAGESLPTKKPFEFYVDVEYLGNLNVDFETQWPELQGNEMIFMIGVGWEEKSRFNFKEFRAEAESQAAEKKLLVKFFEFIRSRTGDAREDPERTAFYHWSPSDLTQLRKSVGRHGLSETLPLNNDCWHDLRKIFLDRPVGIPGAWSYGLKDVAKALAKHDPEYDPQWVGDLEDNSLRVMVLGWQVYAWQRGNNKKEAKEGIAVLKDYLHADCCALWQLLRWLREATLQIPATAEDLPYVGWAQARKSLEISVKGRFYAALNDGKGIQVYLQPALGKTTGKSPINHLIWGDWLEVVDVGGPWYKVQARGTTGWVHKDFVQETPLLEVNFVDVGQGDGCFIITPEKQPRYLLVDAGLEDNMYRFLRWRFNHFADPVEFDAFVITHPDQDHYGGFKNFFDPKDPSVSNISVKRVYHNGVIERKSRDLGKVESVEGQDLDYLTEVILERPQMEQVIEAAKRPGNYLKLLRDIAARDQETKIFMLSSDDGFLPGYEKDDALSIQVLAPVPEAFGGKKCLRVFGAESVTKNGHSVVLRLLYDNVRILLGGDLNIPAETYLLDHYKSLGAQSGISDPLDCTREYLECDIAKACHHGSSDFSIEFLRATNPIATVISSGDEESYSHPRPESLGAMGRFSRIDHPLIFSTELARSAPEKIKRPYQLRREFEDARLKDRVLEFAEDLIVWLGRSISVYGMITLRTDGKRVLIAQKLERQRSPGQRWDQYLLEPGQDGKLTYQSGHSEEE